MNAYVDNDDSRLIFGKEDGKELITKAGGLKTSIKNPYFNVYHWIKGEIYDIEAMVAAIKAREALQMKVTAQQKKKRSDENDLEKVNQNRLSIKQKLQNKSDPNAYVKNIEQVSASDPLTILDGEANRNAADPAGHHFDQPRRDSDSCFQEEEARDLQEDHIAVQRHLDQ